MQSEQLMVLFEKLDSKLDVIREDLHLISLKSSETSVRQLANDKEIQLLKDEVATLKAAHNKLEGAWKLLTVPGLLSAIYVLTNLIKG